MDPNGSDDAGVRQHTDPRARLLEVKDHATPERLATAEAPNKDRVDDNVTATADAARAAYTAFERA